MPTETKEKETNVANQNESQNAMRYEKDGKEYVKLEVIAVRSKTKEGKAYMAFRTYDKNGKRRHLRFTKEVKQIPERNCFIHVPIDKLNVDHSTRKLIFWVKEITDTEVKLVNNEPIDYEDLIVKKDSYI